MPIYEYTCQKCGAFEVTQRITDNALTRCPTCKRRVKKLISNTSFQLKGTGWYITDYARKGKDGSEAKTDNGSKTSSQKSESKSETKSESKKSENPASGSDKASPSASSTS